jgi:hypothetical protein
MTTGTSRLRRSRTTVSTERRILFNTALLGAGEGIGQLTSFCVVVSLARAFGADVLGQYSVSMAVGAVATAANWPGTQPPIREIGRGLPVTARRAPRCNSCWSRGVGYGKPRCILLIDDEGRDSGDCGDLWLPDAGLATTLAPFQATERLSFPDRCCNAS